MLLAAAAADCCIVAVDVGVVVVLFGCVWVGCWSGDVRVFGMTVTMDECCEELELSDEACMDGVVDESDDEPCDEMVEPSDV